MADVARTSIRWLRKRAPVTTVGGVRGLLEVGVRVTNAGTVDWTASPPWQVRGHVFAAGGAYYQDPVMMGVILPDPVPAGGSVDMVVTFVSHPDTPGLEPSELFHPDTLVVVDVVHETVEWLGENPGGTVGQRYVRDSIRDVLSGQAFDVDLARLGGYYQPERGSITVPTSGEPLDLIFEAVASGATHYLLAVTLSATGAAQRLSFRRTPVGGAEESLEDWIVSATTPNQPYDLRHRRADPGDQYRIVVLPNPAGGTVSAMLERIVLPWEETF